MWCILVLLVMIFKWRDSRAVQMIPGLRESSVCHVNMLRRPHARPAGGGGSGGDA